MNGKFLANIALSAGILILVAFAVTKLNASATGIVGLLLPEVTVSDSAAALQNSVTLVDSSVKVPEKGHMVDATFVIENSGDVDVKNIAVLCKLFDAAGVEKGRDKWVVYDTVKSYSRENFTFYKKMFISSSVVRSECGIVDMRLALAPKVKAHPTAAAHGDNADGHGAAAGETAHGNQH